MSSPAPAAAPASRPAPRGASRMRWAIIWLAFAGLTINYLDRSSISVALPFMGEDIHLDKTQQGLILAAFFWSYDFCQLAAGWYVDKVGPRRSFSIAAVWWSIFTMVTAAVHSFWTLIAARLLLGIGESPAPATSAKVVATWFPQRERGLATGIWDSGSRVGAVIAIPVVTLIIHFAGWRTTFIIIGILGLAWALGWWKAYRDPDKHARVNAEELAYIREGGARVAEADDEAAAKLPWRRLFRYRTVIGMMFGFFCLNSVIYFFITFFPTYLVEERDFSLLKLGFFGMIPGICAVLSGWLGGWLADRAIRRGVSVTKVRKTIIVAGMAGGSVIIAAVIVPQAWMALALLSLAYASLTFAGTGIWALPADVAPSSAHVASIGGIQNFASNFAGILTPIMVGYLADETGSFVMPLTIIGVIALIGALNYLFVVGKIEPLPVARAATR
ncbi:MFS transporter [Phytomonospora sp. NPDC050363]|uniref:MFS transporter n=1 Tax=Phytomonospora sp. NPDC050363 TaxID=3155642 RepID=UPI0033C36011